jgi:arsenical pump membrane protein
VLGTLATGFVLGVGNNVVNNLPLGLVAGATLKAAPPPSAITNAVLLGIDLGPNLAVTGSLATILWLIALRKERVEVSFWRFFKLGVVVMPAALAASLLASLATSGSGSSSSPASTTTAASPWERR